jgi:hypothetical protein
MDNVEAKESLISALVQVYLPGLPDGIFSNQKCQFLVIFGGHWNGKVWYIIRPFGI